MENQPVTYIAIDIASRTLSVRSGKTGFDEPNTAAGFAAILRRTRKLERRHFVFEATGGYERELMLFLHDQGETLSLVSAARVRHFARSEGVKAKTDPIDARMIERFAQEKRPGPTRAPSRKQRDLQALVDRREQLSEQLKRERTRQPKCADCVRASLQEAIGFLKERIAELDRAIEELVGSEDAMRQAYETLIAVKGFGPVTCWTIIAHLPEITSLDRAEATALAGLAPFNRDSGKLEGPRSIFGGRSKVRRCLYMATLAAARFNDVIRSWVEGLQARGKHFKVAIVAAMRKMLVHAHSLLKKNKISLA